MSEEYVPSKYAVGYWNEIKKDYQKIKENCAIFEQEHAGLCDRLGLDMAAFDVGRHPDHPPQAIFKKLILSDRDRKLIGVYLSNREKMYLMEKCISNISDDEIRKLAEAYYLERKSQQEIAVDIGHTKSYVSKKLDAVEKNVVFETIDRYFAWKYSVPGGRDCIWNSQWERDYMWQQDVHRGIFRYDMLQPDMSWVKKLQRLGL